MSGARQPAQPAGRTQVRNDLGTPIKLILEPWGREYVLPPGAELELVALGGSATDPFERETDVDGTVIAYAPSSCQGVDLLGPPDIIANGGGSPTDSPFPRLPAGLSTRDFMRRVFGKK